MTAILELPRTASAGFLLWWPTVLRHQESFPSQVLAAPPALPIFKGLQGKGRILYQSQSGLARSRLCHVSLGRALDSSSPGSWPL